MVPLVVVVWVEMLGYYVTEFCWDWSLRRNVLVWVEFWDFVSLVFWDCGVCFWVVFGFGVCVIFCLKVLDLGI